MLVLLALDVARRDETAEGAESSCHSEATVLGFCWVVKNYWRKRRDSNPQGLIRPRPGSGRVPSPIGLLFLF
jgi:hypothetical protein